MATADARQRARESPVKVTAVLSAVGYVLVLGTFAGMIPIYPDISIETVNLLSDAIAVVNSVATVSLVLGWYWIRKGAVKKHRAAMLTAFSLIIVFLVLYLTKVGGAGGEKHILVDGFPYYAYLIMLAVHIILSVVSVPVVLFALVLGLTHTPAELKQTAHAKVGRIAASAWIVSLVLGVVTYVMLNHIYHWEIPA
ncbi:DUF420 domain-containing protein [Haladaptatus caseinilyticus]|uniref:DUF420 domain-containing protein n=1 Tax=Haladaptatus caseinilyticus TaxID=2993314 RepID=UPI00224ABEAC|nr:DUF420 domain-containing protein [Haladaptatus caseinilyticus]